MGKILQGKRRNETIRPGSVFQALLGALCLIELGGFDLLEDRAQGLLQELAGALAVAARVASGLHLGLALRRDDDFDDLHDDASAWRSRPSSRAIWCWCLARAFEARLSRFKPACQPRSLRLQAGLPF